MTRPMPFLSDNAAPVHPRCGRRCAAPTNRTTHTMANALFPQELDARFHRIVFGARMRRRCGLATGTAARNSGLAASGNDVWCAPRAEWCATAPKPIIEVE